jgi:hypothetical protein
MGKRLRGADRPLLEVKGKGLKNWGSRGEGGGEKASR